MQEVFQVGTLVPLEAEQKLNALVVPEVVITPEHLVLPVVLGVVLEAVAAHQKMELPQVVELEHLDKVTMAVMALETLALDMKQEAVEVLEGLAAMPYQACLRALVEPELHRQ
jgi:hypothetical protein